MMKEGFSDREGRTGRARGVGAKGTQQEQISKTKYSSQNKQEKEKILHKNWRSRPHLPETMAKRPSHRSHSRGETVEQATDSEKDLRQELNRQGSTIKDRNNTIKDLERKIMLLTEARDQQKSGEHVDTIAWGRKHLSIQ